MKQTTQKPPTLQTYACGVSESHGVPGIGCQQMIPVNDFNFEAHLCKNCAAELVNDYGVAYEMAGAIRVALRSAPWFILKTPKLDALEKRTLIRVLMLAASAPVRGSTPEEIRMGDRLRELHPSALGKNGSMGRKSINRKA